MTNCEAVVNKSYFDNQQFTRKCPTCKQIFNQEHHSQRYCHDSKCRKSRHVIQQTEYRQRKSKEVSA